MSGINRMKLKAEDVKLKQDLAGLIPWVGEPAEGPQWATPQAKARNKAMCEKALEAACGCFTDDYDGLRELANLN